MGNEETRLRSRNMPQGGGSFKGKITKKKSAGALRRQLGKTKVGERKCEKKSKLFKKGHWGDRESLETTKAINKKIEDELHGSAAKRGAPLSMVKPSGDAPEPPKKGGKTGIAAQIKKLNKGR